MGTRWSEHTQPARPDSRGDSGSCALFWIGFFGFYLVNGAAGVLAGWVAGPIHPLPEHASSTLNVLLFRLNVIVLLILALIPQLCSMAYGMLAALGLIFCLVLLASVFFLAVCFTPRAMLGPGAGL